MNLKFKAALQKEWTLLDDKVILGKKRNTIKRDTISKIICKAYIGYKWSNTNSCRQ